MFQSLLSSAVDKCAFPVTEPQGLVPGAATL